MLVVDTVFLRSNDISLLKFFYHSGSCPLNRFYINSFANFRNLNQL